MTTTTDDSDSLDWGTLLDCIDEGRCTPFLGAGACHGVLPLASDLARDLAREYEYPLEDCTDLARVAQYLAVTRNRMRPKDLLTRRLSKIPPPSFDEPDEPHGVLARLPLPVYLTTNYDNFLFQALRGQKKDPRREVCRWNSAVRDEPSVFDGEPRFEPSPANPLVFHLHGHFDLRESLVLTEDDYIDFLVRVTRDEALLPPRVRRSLTGASLLFLGYRISDWTFRVLYQSLVVYLEKSLQRGHVSVQLVPGGEEITDEQKAKVQSYLNRYYKHLDIHVYWGTCQKFVAELSERWEAYTRGR